MNKKLAERMKEYSIPEVPYLPQGRVVLVFRLPSETKSAGGIHLPDAHTGPRSQGVLVAAGLAARDLMRDSMIEIGDVVQFGRFEGHEQEFAREAAEKGRYLLQMKVDGLLGSVDALERLRDYDIVFDEEANDGEGQHIYARKAA